VSQPVTRNEIEALTDYVSDLQIEHAARNPWASVPVEQLLTADIAFTLNSIAGSLDLIALMVTTLVEAQVNR
jgi:hypothetical protein